MKAQVLLIFPSLSWDHVHSNAVFIFHYYIQHDEASGFTFYNVIIPDQPQFHLDIISISIIFIFQKVAPPEYLPSHLISLSSVFFSKDAFTKPEIEA